MYLIGMNYFKFGYPIAVEMGDETHAFGIVVPDLPGCFSAGDTLNEAITNAYEAISLWLETACDLDMPIPEPTQIQMVKQKYPEYADWIWRIIKLKIRVMAA